MRARGPGTCAAMIFTTAARVVIGGLFFGHGTQKLFGWFGGHGIEGTAGFFEQIGMRPGRRNAIAAGAAEAGGGVLFAAGLALPLACAALTSTMATAIWAVHLEKGPWSAEGGYEYNAVLIAAVAALTEERDGTARAAAGVAAGVAGAALAVEAARREQPGGGNGGGGGETPGGGAPQDEERFVREPASDPSAVR